MRKRRDSHEPETRVPNMGCGSTRQMPPSTMQAHEEKAKPRIKDHYRVTYRSVLRKDVNIPQLVEKARIKNHEMGISGALWMDEKSRRVRQILEGPEVLSHPRPAVKKDERHSLFTIELEEYPLRRAFKRWGGMALAENPDFHEKGRNTDKDDNYYIQIK
eukprot:915-Amorphochlora_amoeboformis.AAC.2